MTDIQIDLQPFQDSHALLWQQDRPQWLQKRKQQIRELRNQYLSQRLDCSILDADIERSEFGKPYLHSHLEFAFNYSHSQHYFALASSQNLNHIGVDIEEFSRIVKFAALAQHAFHPNELRLWQACDYDPVYWFKVWTTKEAVLKASGLGIRLNLKEFDTQVQLTPHTGTCQHSKIGTFAYQNFVLPDLMLTVAWADDLSGRTAAPDIHIHSTFIDHEIAKTINELRTQL